MKKNKTPHQKKTKTKVRVSHEELISKPALKLIDEAAAFLKMAICKGEKLTEPERKTLKKKALSFVDLASERLTSAVHQGAGTIRTGVKSLAHG